MDEFFTSGVVHILCHHLPDRGGIRQMMMKDDGQIWAGEGGGRAKDDDFPQK